MGETSFSCYYKKIIIKKSSIFLKIFKNIFAVLYLQQLMASSELLTNKNYIDFVERYAFDLVKFAVEVCGMTPTWQQIELLQSVQPSGSRTTVRSGHGTGKSRSIAVIVLWHLLCYPDSNTLITAPKIEQVRNVAWKEIVDVINLMKIRGNHAWIAEYVEAEAERIFIKNSKQTWFVIA